ncbi:Nucleic acid-binding protein [Corchorus capsularis]|uniref:Nucleic acid-binding protein n=1 Tax=Corchorus capsularis TaxID=210143 RepID=A0A1R3G4N8_COCAP|nr:Nucleic acid-binding protein [Corchorus capsularis]
MLSLAITPFYSPDPRMSKCSVKGVHKYPRHYFLFSSFEDLTSRIDTDEMMTDIIGMLVGATEPFKVKVKRTNEMAEKRNISLRLISGEEISISAWTSCLQGIDIDSLTKQKPKPVMIFAGTTIKSLSGKPQSFYVTTTTATKIYVDLDVPQTTAIKERYKDDDSAVQLLEDDGSGISEERLFNTSPESTIIHLLSQRPANITDKRFKIQARVLDIDETNGWYYSACPACMLSMIEINGILRCRDQKHAGKKPKPTMSLTLFIRDQTAEMEVVAFGNVAERMTAVTAEGMPPIKNTSSIKLPKKAEDILNREYTFIVGLPNQALKRGYLSYKIFAFRQSETAPENQEKRREKRPMEPPLPAITGDQPPELPLSTPADQTSQMALSTPQKQDQLSDRPHLKTDLTAAKKMKHRYLQQYLYITLCKTLPF